MKTTRSVLLAGYLIGAAHQAYAGWPGDKLPKCPVDSVKVGATCVDKYEASVWQLPAGSWGTSRGKALIAKIQTGKVKLTDLTTAGATPLGCFTGQTTYPPAFSYDGNWTPESGSSPPTPEIYAVSIPGVLPTTCTTWFQAEQACALSNKRLIRNQEWQRAAAGTKDPGSNDGSTNTKCNTSSTSIDGARNTGLAGSIPGDATGCVSNWGAEDMVGNVSEWVGDWADKASSCTDWTSQGGIAGGDLSCFGGTASSASLRIPGALARGGDSGAAAGAGVFAVDAISIPTYSDFVTGFRCAR